MIRRRTLLAAFVLGLVPNRGWSRQVRGAPFAPGDEDGAVADAVFSSLKILARGCVQAVRGAGGVESCGHMESSFGTRLISTTQTGMSMLDFKTGVEEDFADGRTIEVDGWILSEAEAKYYIALSLSQVAKRASPG